MVIRKYSKMDAIESWRTLGEYWSPVLFWSHRPKDKEVVDKECLSQWYRAIFCESGITYYSTEQYMMYQKALLFKDEETAKKIIWSESAAKCKELGRQVKNFDEATWNKHKCSIVFMGNLLKFTQNGQLQNYLIGTGQRYLVEASPEDAIWGIGISARDKGATEPVNWKGQNLLGYILMEVRDCLTIENP